MKTTDYILNHLKKTLSDKRYLHSLGCADCAKKLAEKFGEDENKAYLAGLIHDCAKNYSDSELLDIIKNNVKTGFSNSELKNPKTYHAIAGSYIAQKEFEIEDKKILQAVRYHTIGAPYMTLFDKIVFLADKIEANTRNQDYSREIWEIIQNNGAKGLDLALFRCYCETIKSLVERNLYICPITIDVYNNLQESLQIP